MRGAVTPHGRSCGRVVLMPFRAQSSDTSRETEAFLVAAYRQLDAAEKLERVGSLGRMLRSVVLADLRSLHPAADERELTLRYAARLFDPETMRTVFEWEPDEAQGR